MKKLIQLEELGLLVLSIFFLHEHPFHLAWWWYLLLFFSPDLGMLGYAVNARVGAICYNFLHHRLVFCLMLVAGYVVKSDTWVFMGWMFMAHAAFDRLLGYGLKLPTGFKHTHLGTIGKHS